MNTNILNKFLIVGLLLTFMNITQAEQCPPVLNCNSGSCREANGFSVHFAQSTTGVFNFAASQYAKKSRYLDCSYLTASGHQVDLSKTLPDSQTPDFSNWRYGSDHYFCPDFANSYTNDPQTRAQHCSW